MRRSIWCRLVSVSDHRSDLGVGFTEIEGGHLASEMLLIVCRPIVVNNRNLPVDGPTGEKAQHRENEGRAQCARPEKASWLVSRGPGRACGIASNLYRFDRAR